MSRSRLSRESAMAGVRPQQQRSRDTVEAILELADRLFSQHGVNEITLGQIASEADLPTATVYRYFPSKEDLIAQLMYGKLDEMLLKAQKILDEARNLDGFFEALTAVLWDSYHEMRTHPYLDEAFSALLLARAQRDSLVIENRNWVDMFYVAGRRFIENFSDEKLRLRFRVLNEMWNGVVRASIALSKDDADEMMRETIDIVLRELNNGRS